jgi:hypothetical protein
MGVCWSCNKTIDANNYHRLDRCDSCGKDTHACRNCEFHDRAFNNECTESQADRVVDKEKSNFCDYFKPSGRAGGNAASKDALKAAAEALFKKKS